MALHLQEFCAFLLKLTGVPGHPAKPQWKYLHTTEMKQLPTNPCEENPTLRFCFVETNGQTPFSYGFS